MVSSKNNLEFEIFGNTYNLSVTENDTDYLKTVVKFVDDKMHEVSSTTNSNVSTSKVAVLAALNIADELFKLKNDLEKKEDLVNRKTEYFIKLIEKET